MSVRRCATQGCAGTLPAGTGKHCPRCGGTEFIRPRRRGRYALIVLAVLAVVGVALIVAIGSSRKDATAAMNGELAGGMHSEGRQALVDAHDVAAKMTVATARDEAFADVLHRALAQHDFEYACQLGGEMTMAEAKDKCLLETVEQALKAHQNTWATRAADEIVTASTHDEALKKILDATGTRSTATEPTDVDAFWKKK